MKHKHTIEELQTAVSKTTSIRSLLLELGIAARGGNYQTIRKRLIDHNIDTSHFTGMAWSKGKTLQPKQELSNYLNNSVPINSYRLKNRLLQEKVLTYQCSNCRHDTWLDLPIPLELDHIDGNSSNNNLENLRLLCPNCHALTPTYRGKNKRKS